MQLNASESSSTARTSSSDEGPWSVSMAREELPYGPLREDLLFVGVPPGPGRLGRLPQDQGTGVEQASERSELLLWRQGPEPRDVLEDHLGLARELDGKVHGRLLDRGLPQAYCTRRKTAPMKSNSF